MVTNTNTNTDTRTWWQRALDTSVDALEDHFFDPLDEHTSRWRRVRAYRVASTARWHAEQHAVRCLDSHARAERVHAWASAEEAAGYARAGLHTDCPTTCCALLVRLYRDRGELLQALAVTEQQGSQLDDIPARMRRLAGDQFAAMARTWSPFRKSELAGGLVRQLATELGAGIKPIRQLYPARKGPAEAAAAGGRSS